MLIRWASLWYITCLGLHCFSEVYDAMKKAEKNVTHGHSRQWDSYLLNMLLGVKHFGGGKCLVETSREVTSFQIGDTNAKHEAKSSSATEKENTESVETYEAPWESHIEYNINH